MQSRFLRSRRSRLLGPPLTRRPFGNRNNLLLMALRLYRLWIPVMLVGLWGIYGGLLVRQQFLVEQAASMSDTGLSFGYHFLSRFCGPALTLFTISVVMVAFILNWKRQRTC